MVGRFGSREICDVTFKASQEGQKIGTKNFHKGQPVFVIDTATASSMEQATTTVYAQGGKGYNRLIAWEGEKTVTFNITDALISPLGLAMLTGAGLADANEKALKHIHMTIDLALDAAGEATLDLDQLNDELGITADALNLCYEAKFKPYATVLDGNGAIVDWVDANDITITSTGTAVFDGTLLIDATNAAKVAVAGIANQTIKLDFYLAMSEKATQVTIAPDSFGGTFYVEADTLYRNQNGQDMAATLTFPKAKIQSGFTLSMSPTGDPSTFDFVMDAMPGYTYFDSTKKVVCDIMIVGDDAKAEDVEGHEEHKDLVGFNIARIDSSKLTDGSSSDQYIVENNNCIKSVSVNGDVATLKVDMAGLQSYDSSDSSQGKAKWVGLIIETGEDTLENVTYNGTPLGIADIADATSVGAPAGAFVLWLKADIVKTTPKTITIGTVDGSKESREVTIKIVAA